MWCEQVAFHVAQKREAILLRIASDLEAHEPAILDANAVDVAAAERRHIDATLLQRLRLKPAKLRTLAAGIRAIAAQEEPLRKVRPLTCCPLARTKSPRCLDAACQSCWYAGCSACAAHQLECSKHIADSHGTATISDHISQLCGCSHERGSI